MRKFTMFITAGCILFLITSYDGPSKKVFYYEFSQTEFTKTIESYAFAEQMTHERISTVWDKWPQKWSFYLKPLINISSGKVGTKNPS